MRYMEVGRVFKYKGVWCVVRKSDGDVKDCKKCALNKICLNADVSFNALCDSRYRKTNDYVYYHKLTESELNGGMMIKGVCLPKKMLERSLYNRMVGFIEFEKLVVPFADDIDKLFIPNTIREVTK